MAYWLMKSEPGTYSWADLVRDGKTEWDGVRNPTARINLKAMQVGDEAFFYHSGEERAIVGVMRIRRPWRPDGADGAWASAEVEPVRPLTPPVSLKAVKADARLKAIELVRQSRLSVCPIRPEEWDIVLGLSAAA